MDSFYTLTKKQYWIFDEWLVGNKSIAQGTSIRVDSKIENNNPIGMIDGHEYCALICKNEENLMIILVDKKNKNTKIINNLPVTWQWFRWNGATLEAYDFVLDPEINHTRFFKLSKDNNWIPIAGNQKLVPLHIERADYVNRMVQMLGNDHIRTYSGYKLDPEFGRGMLSMGNSYAAASNDIGRVVVFGELHENRKVVTGFFEYSRVNKWKRREIKLHCHNCRFISFLKRNIIIGNYDNYNNANIKIFNDDLKLLWNNNSLLFSSRFAFPKTLKTP